MDNLVVGTFAATGAASGLGMAALLRYGMRTVRTAATVVFATVVMGATGVLGSALEDSIRSVPVSSVAAQTPVLTVAAPTPALVVTLASEGRSLK